jgi:hypothetical protein
MAGVPLDEFTTLMGSQGPAWMRGPEVMINENVRTSYTGNRIVAAGNMQDMIQAGSKITDRIFLENQSDYKRYNPNDEHTYPQPQTGTTWEVPWAFAFASASWTKQDIGLNAQSMGKRYRAQMYKRVMRQIHQNLWTGVCNGIEDEFWARPHYAEMEGSTPSVRKPQSIPCFVNEFSDGIIPAIVDQGSTAWTSIQGITRAASDNSKWQCYSVGGGAGAKAQSSGYLYDETASTMPWEATGIFKVFNEAYWNLRFDRLPMKPEYSDKKSSPQVIWTSIKGTVLYENALRQSNDYLRGMGKATGSDPAYPGPSYNNIPLEVISQFDDVGNGTHGALLYSDGTEACDEQGRNADGSVGTTLSIIGPRFYWINTEYLKFVTHEENYCTLTKPFTPSKQPGTRVQVMDLWNNTVCRSPRRLGVVGPNADVTYA